MRQRTMVWSRDSKVPSIRVLSCDGKSIGAVSPDRHPVGRHWGVAMNEIRRSESCGWEGGIYGQFPTLKAAKRALELLADAAHAGIAR